MRIAAIDPVDIRFPTSRDLTGSDAMNPDPDYSLAYLTIRLDDGFEGHGFAFTIGRGNELVVHAIKVLTEGFLSQPVESLLEDMGSTWRSLIGDSQLRWLGPDKGVIHMAAAAVTNALWDLKAKREGKPVWRLLTDMSPDDIASLVEFRYLQDFMDAEEARGLLRSQQAGRALRIDMLHEDGLPAYTTSAGWLGYSEVQIAESVDRALGEGFEHFKIKVGGGINEDARRALLVRGLIGSERSLMMDANQVWGVSEAVDQMAVLEEFDPAWIEEPTSPDDILGHRAIARAVDPIAVATGEHVHNQVMFKQFLQAGALGVCQVDPCRVAGLNEALAVLLMAAKSDVPVCPHAGGAGLGECVQHLSVFDHVAVGGVREDRVVEYVDHLHEHFLDPVRVSGGRYVLPDAPGFNTELRPEALARFRFPDGTEWL